MWLGEELGGRYGSMIKERVVWVAKLSTMCIAQCVAMWAVQLFVVAAVLSCVLLDCEYICQRVWSAKLDDTHVYLGLK